MNNQRRRDSKEKNIYAVPRWRLVWWRFRKHKLAMVASVVLIVMYLAAILAPFVSPQSPHQRSLAYREAPPQPIRFVGENGFQLRPFTYPLKSRVDTETFQTIYTLDKDRPTPIYFFVEGFEYELFGIFTSNIHLFGTGDPKIPINIFGADDLGRDLFARVLYGARISLSIGLVGVFVSLFIGVLIGGIGGYFGGRIDTFIQRLIELIRSIPQLPLWMGLSAALPSSWSAIQVYISITIILSLMSWTDLARVVRGKFLSLREEDFVVAARLMGRSHLETIFIHMLPSFASHIIASLTLAIPNMILGETSLSFLGIGLQSPTISWGVLLQKAQNLNAIATAPWLLIPGLFVILTVLAFNFLGDGLRDAADPYAK
jgi:peptide/nickel transport system permease protein